MNSFAEAEFAEDGGVFSVQRRRGVEEHLVWVESRFLNVNSFHSFVVIYEPLSIVIWDPYNAIGRLGKLDV